MRKTLKYRGITLVEVLVVTVIAGLLAAGVMRYYTFAVQRDLEWVNKGAAQQELDTLTNQLTKDFERHSSAAASIEALPATSLFLVPPGGRPKCQNLTIRQKILGAASVPDTVRKIEYQTRCNGPDYSPGVPASELHPDLAPGCAHPPTVTRTDWANEAAGGPGSATVSPSPTLKAAMAVCFRPNRLVNPTQYNAEVSIAYRANDKFWRVLRKSVALTVNEFGSGVEILPPQ